MEFQFQPGDFVRIPGLNRPCSVLSVRTHDRVFAGRKDLVGTKKELSEPWYTVQLDGSSSTRFVAESKMTLIQPGDIAAAREAAEELPSGPAQSLSPVASSQAALRAKRKALEEERLRLKEELETAELAAEVDTLKKRLNPDKAAAAALAAE